MTCYLEKRSCRAELLDKKTGADLILLSRHIGKSKSEFSFFPKFFGSMGKRLVKSH